MLSSVARSASGLARTLVTAEGAAAPVAAAVRASLSSVASSSAVAADPEFVVFPRESASLDADLNWSLADDGVAPRGGAFRNADSKTLVMHSTGKVDASKSLVADLPTGAVPKYATDEYPGTSVVDIDAFESLLEQVCAALGQAPTLFVEDAAVGSERASEIRVRVISDSPEYALYMRQMLNRTPLYSPEAFPRPVVVYVASGLGSDPISAVDIDPESSTAAVVSAGAVPLSVLSDQIVLAASQLHSIGGYRHVAGGGVRVQAAREDGTLGWSVNDRYWVAPADAEHPDLLTLRADAIFDGKGAVNLHVGDAGAASKAAADGTLFSAHHTVWRADGLSRFWGGVVGAPKNLVGSGSLVVSGVAVAPLADSAPLAAAHPSNLYISTGGSAASPADEGKKGKGKGKGKGKKAAAKKGEMSSADAVGVLADTLGLTDAEAEKLNARLTEVGTKCFSA